MIGRRIGVAAMIAAAATTVAGQRFSVQVDTVRLEVMVKRANRPVAGLQPSDFEVRDNGVAQRPDLVAYGVLPLNVVLALDVSGSVAGDRLNRLRSAGLTLIDALEPNDRAAVLTFADAVTIRTPFAPTGPELRSEMHLQLGGTNTSLIDAMQAALVLAQSGTGRPLLIVFSDGADTSSFLSAASVEDTAKRTGAVVYAVTTGGGTGFLGTIAELTGGDTFDVGGSGSLEAAFARILDQFRHSYVLSYVPSGVTQSGWHTISVRVKGGGDVRTRPGYLAGP
jgi:VWFA-related protein